MATESKRSRDRSPNYPAAGLETAITRAGQIYTNERQHPTPVEAVLQHWGYKNLNGPAGLTLAALKKYGLLTYEGTGQAKRVRLTDLAVNILANPNVKEREAAIKTAALTPPIIRELWEQYSGILPSDETLGWELSRQRGFTDRGVREFLAVFRGTISFAKLAPTDSVVVDDHHDDEEDDVDEEPERHQDRQDSRRSLVRRQKGQGVLTYAVPVAAGNDITLEGQFPLTPAEWTQFMAVLNAMKPALVSERTVGVSVVVDGEEAD